MGCYPAPCGRVSRLCILDRVLPHRTLLQRCLMGTRQILSARDDFKRAYSKKQARYETDETSGTRGDAAGLLLGEKLGHRRGLRARACSARRLHSIGPCNTLAPDGPCLLTHWPKEGTLQAQDQTKVVWHSRASVPGGVCDIPGMVRRRTRRRLPG